jgi:Xaa-Pro aminopeptidase
MSDWPMLSIAERDRRWALTRNFLHERDLSCLVMPGGRSRELLDSYLSNEATGGCGVVVFPRDSEPVFVVVGANRLFGRADIMERDLENWIEDFRIGLHSSMIPEILVERGLEKTRVGVIGLESIGPAGEEEGLITHQFWSRLRANAPDVEFVDVSADFALLTAPKSEEEIELVRHGAAVGEAACAAAVAAAGVGVSEHEIYVAAMTEIARGGAVIVPPMFLLRAGPQNLGHATPHWFSPRRMPRLFERGDLALAEIFTVYGNIETQQQLTFVIGEPSVSQRFVADVARRSYELGLEALRPGIMFSEVFKIMQKPVLEAGCWHINPLIHSLAPLNAWGGMMNGLAEQSEIDESLRQISTTQVMGDFEIKAGTLFAVEPSVAKEFERVTVGATVVVTENGCEELNDIGTNLVVVDT